MNIYYLLLLMTRFHSDPRAGATLLEVGGAPVTPVKIVGLLTVLIATFAARPDNAAPRLTNRIAPLFLVFAAFPVIATLASGLPAPSEQISSLLSFGLLLIATRSLVTTQERLTKVVRVLIVSSAFASLWIYKQKFIGHLERPPGLEQDPNYEALTLLAGLPFAVWMARHETGTWGRRVGAVCAAMMGISIVITQSRAGLIALGVMTVATLIYSRHKVTTFALLAVAAILFFAFAPESLTQRFHSVKISGDATNGDEASTRVHVELTKAGLTMISAHPVFGVGLDRFKAEALNYNPYIFQVGGRAYIAHDTYVQEAAEGGVLTLVLFLSMIGVAFKNLTAARASANLRLADLAASMQLGLLGFCVAAVSVTAEYIFTFWLIIFLSQNLREIAQAAPTPDVQARKRSINRAPSRMDSTAPVVAIERRLKTGFAVTGRSEDKPLGFGARYN